MVKHPGGTLVKKGHYWSPRSLDLSVVPPGGGRLPGTGDRRYVKVPLPVLVVVVPVAGALFLVLLPLIGAGALALAATRKVLGRVKQGAGELAATIAPGWQPGDAHLTGRPGEGAGTDESSPELDRLAEEIDERRGSPK
jgi:hypothetical protein